MFLFTARRINAVEAFKHTLPQRTRYPGTVVGDDQRNTAAPLGCRKLDFAAGRRICDRVVQQDGQRLPDAREIASLHCGKLTLRDTPGGGATFILYLPCGVQ